MSYKGSHITKEIKIIISLLVVGFLLFLFIKNFNEQKEYLQKWNLDGLLLQKLEFGGKMEIKL